MNSTDTDHLQANLVDLQQRQIRFVDLHWHEGVICTIEELGEPQADAGYLLPGFIDAHVHIESAMLTPAEFGRIALRHGTTAVVADPHEIANVLGTDGVRYMLENARQTPFHAFFGAPSCVPATPFETAHGALGVSEIQQLFAEPEVCCLSEMMNFPGVLNGDPEVQAKLALARRLGYPVDGHAPGLKGAQAAAYVAAGITTDHECFSLEEARDKLAAGMAVLIREGSAARNFETLHPLISEAPKQVMFCSDDKHPDDLLQGHINQMVARAVAHGHDLYDVLECACNNPIEHYRLPLGQLRVDDPMDGQLVDNLTHFKPRRVWLAGEPVAEKGRSLLPSLPAKPVNQFDARPITPGDLQIPWSGGPMRVIGVEDGSLVTRELQIEPRVEQGVAVADSSRDLLQILVLNRYQPTAPAVAFVQGFGLQRGAIASSVAHDSHNIIAVGANPQAICRAVNALIDNQGGVAVADESGVSILPLPIAGIISDRDGDFVGTTYAGLDRQAHDMGSRLQAPFMTLSFMALLVIPELKLSDRGLFDGRIFQFTPLAV